MKFPAKLIPSNQILFLYLVLLIGFIRFLTLYHYNFQFTGNDDLIFWHSAADYSKGIFHEPFFYGQNYNFSFESIVAVPLIWMGVPVYYALPIVSSVVGIFPFVFISVILYRRKYYAHALFFLLILLTLPTEYDLLTSITRGFTSGIFFTAFLIFPLLNPHSKKSFFILGLFASLAYVLNPNSIIFSFAVCSWLFFENYRKPSFYLISGVSALPAFVLLYFAQQFYVNHPDYVVHSMWQLEYSFDQMVRGLSHLDKFFRYLTPVLWFGNWLIVAVIIVLGFLVIRRNWKKGLSLLLTILVIIFTLGINKVNDEIGVLFLCSTRMFLAIPILFGLAVFWYKEKWNVSPRFKAVIFTLATVVFVLKIVTNQQVIRKHTSKTEFGPVAIKNLDELRKECSEINRLTEKYRVDFVVFVPQGRISTAGLEFYNYGCSVLTEKSCSGMLSMYERRTWVYREGRVSKRETLMLFNVGLDKIEDIKTKIDCEVLDVKSGIVLIRKNKKSVVEISHLFGFEVKRNPY